MREAINIAASTPLGGNRQTMLDGATIRNYYQGTRISPARWRCGWCSPVSPGRSTHRA